MRRSLRSVAPRRSLRNVTEYERKALAEAFSALDLASREIDSALERLRDAFDSHDDRRLRRWAEGRRRSLRRAYRLVSYTGSGIEHSAYLIDQQDGRP